MRALIHLGIAGSLLLSFAQAPFLHSHPSDPHHEHARGFAHTHWQTSSDGPAWKTNDYDSDARILDWLAGDGNSPAKFVVALPESLNEIVFVARDVLVSGLTPHYHDPPWRLIPYFRGPPA